MKDGMFYVGKIVKEKTNLLDMPIIENEYYSYFYDSMKDTYGNTYSKVLMFEYSNNFTTFNAGREYSYLKCTVAMKEQSKGNASLQIIVDDNIIYTSSEITNMTEPFEVDIPINQASKISIGTIGNSTSRVFITNAVLYNQG